jgi:uncharacterized protein (DUF488 family)
MDLFSEIEKRKAANARKLAGLGVASAMTNGGSVKIVREGSSLTIFTIGYERRDGEGLFSVLRDQSVRAVADIRERPVSRKPEFRAAALRDLCETAGIEYQPWPMLGSTAEQRDELQASGDFRSFADRFRDHAMQTMQADLARLAEGVKRIPTALLCYERLHEDCHRSVIAELVAEGINATVIAIQ